MTPSHLLAGEDMPNQTLEDKVYSKEIETLKKLIKKAQKEAVTLNDELGRTNIDSIWKLLGEADELVYLLEKAKMMRNMLGFAMTYIELSDENRRFFQDADRVTKRFDERFARLSI